MKWDDLKEFKPTAIFLAKFLGLYLAGNLLYGLYITNFYPRPDPVTNIVTNQTAFLLTACGWPVTTYPSDKKPTTSIVYDRKGVLAVYEGCNGLNTMIIFLAFVFAFGKWTNKILWFIPVGLLIIHLANLARIGLLFFVSQYRPSYMYFTHKYLFTAVLYVVVFLLWVWWVRKLVKLKE
jgi:exosortase family protein XrtF